MRTFINYINNIIFPLIPESKGYGLKRAMLRLAGAKVGKSTKISSSLKVYGCGELIIGDYTWIGYQVMIATSSRVEIGRNVDIAPRVYIGTGTHVVDVNSPNVAGEGISRDVKIGNGCWLCVNSMILPGVSVADKTVVAAGAVVNHSFYDNNILLAGIPAKIIRNL